MAFAVISFLVAFLLIASGGLLVFYRDRIQDRISSALYPRANKRTISIDHRRDTARDRRRGRAI